MRIINRFLFTTVLCLLVTVIFAQSQKPYERTQINGKEFYIYIVNQAEGFYSITQQFHVTQAEIEKYNPETKSGLRKGQRLLIPTEASASFQPSHKATVATKNETDEFFTHTIMVGETLDDLAKMYNISKSDIVAQNPGLTTPLIVGHSILIPQATHLYRDKNQYTYHTIQPKETLYSVAKQHGVTMQTIMDENPGLTSSSFTTGRIIRIKPLDVAQLQESKQQALPTTVYIVRKKETLYSISRKLDITLTQLLEMNPGITQIKVGDKLIVPEVNKLKEETNPTLAAQEMHDILEEASQITKQGNVNVAVMLPFNIPSSNTQIKQNRYIEFYEGFLLAVDSIRNSGASIDVHVYDTQVEGIDAILRDPELEKVDLIIGPATTNEINKVSAFSKAHHINMVNPFTFDSEATDKNPYLFQVNTPNSYLYAETAMEFIHLFKKHKIVFINEIGKESDKKDFVEYLRNELDIQQIAYEDFEYADGAQLAKVDSILNLKGSVVFVPISAKKESLSLMATSLHIVHRNNAALQISLFGYPEWQMYTSEFGHYFYELDTYIYTRIYVNPFSADTKAFYNKFKYWYHKDLLPIYPRYGMLGFDTGMYFLRAVSKYGKKFDAHIDMMPAESLQTAMCFRRINNWSGFINRCLYFVNFRPNSTIQKIEVK